MAALEIENKLMAREATQVQSKKGGGTDSIQQPLSRGTFGGNFPLCGFLVAQMVKKKKNLPAMQETQVRTLGQEDPLELGMATHPSIFAWRIPWTEEPGGLQFGITKSQT